MTLNIPPLPDSRCALITRIGPGKTSTFHCEQGSMAGRFVNILIPGKRKTLTLCEVEVYGAPEGKSAMARFLVHIVTNAGKTLSAINTCFASYNILCVHHAPSCISCHCIILFVYFRDTSSKCGLEQARQVVAPDPVSHFLRFCRRVQKRNFCRLLHC